MIKRHFLNFKKLCIVTTICLSLSACAGQSARMDTTTHIADPLEPFNRGVTQLNKGLDIVILDPLAKGYNAILPEFVRNAIGNFLTNLRAPLYFANNLLQGDVGGAGVTAARFVMNSTIGLGGLIDVAAKQGLNHESEDFGQTLAVWGLGDGFYIVWPVFGPSSLRDSIGMGVDAFADPVRIVTFDEGEEWIYYTRNGVEALHEKAKVVDVISDLRENSLDYYSAIKSIYEQRRIALIHDNSYDVSKSQSNYDEYDEYDNYDE